LFGLIGGCLCCWLGFQLCHALLKSLKPLLVIAACVCLLLLRLPLQELLKRQRCRCIEA
jgi:hypothetical protein